MSSETEQYDPLYLKGIGHFNECDFFEAHETWEELWTEYRGADRKFYQGLIQAAVALHHFGNGNVRGARKVYRSSLNYFAEYDSPHLGLDLDGFRRQYELCFRAALAADEDYPKLEIDPELIPEIHLTPAAAPS